MNLFSISDLKALDTAHSSDINYDLARAHARNQLAWLHERMYGEIRGRRWDIYFRPEWSLSSAHVSADSPVIDALRLRYTKSETVARMLPKQFGGPPLHWEELSWLGMGLDARGVFIEWTIPAAARFDAQNFYNKLTMGAPGKRTFRQLLAELGGEAALTLKAQDQEILHVRCSRLVDLQILNNTLEKYVPGTHEFKIAIRFLVTDARLATNVAADELMYRLAQLYGMLQFGVWSPRNNYLAASRSAAAESH